MMKKKYKPIRTPIMRGEANYFLSKLFLFGDIPKRLGAQLWRHGFRAGVKAARKQFEEMHKEG